MTEYTAANADGGSMIVAAVAIEEESTIAITYSNAMVTDQPLGEFLSVYEGETVVKITVTAGDDVKVYTVTITRPYDVTLNSLTLGSLTLSPTFDPAVTEYTASTTNATNAVTAGATSAFAIASIMVNGVEHTSGEAATWVEGENTVVVTVTNGTAEETYTVVVTKTTE